MADGNQMTIYDFLEPDLELMEEPEMVNRLSMGTGLQFIYRDKLSGWRAKIGKVEYDTKFGRYSTDSKKRFIHCGYTSKENGYEGCGKPCDSVDEAIEFLKESMKRYGQLH